MGDAKRKAWLEKYKSDPEFRLKRLLLLSRRNYRKSGGYQSRNAYEVEIAEARAAIAKAKGEA